MKNYSTFITENINLNPSFKYNNMIDYTLLDNNATNKDIIQLCEKAIKFGVKSVCIMPKHVKLATEELNNSNILVCTVIDFPGGNNDQLYKVAETKQVLSDGADEVDMVLNYQYLKNEWNTTYEEKNGGDLEIGKSKKLVDEIESLVNLCHSTTNKNGEPVVLKVIVESGLLTKKQTMVATELCDQANANFIKTSTGKVVGAQIDKVEIMARIIKENNSDMKIKVSGGIRTLDQIIKYHKLGASRFGMGFGSVDKLNGLENDTEGY